MNFQVQVLPTNGIAAFAEPCGALRKVYDAFILLGEATDKQASIREMGTKKEGKRRREAKGGSKTRKATIS